GEHGGGGGRTSAAFIEQLCARLGVQAVYGLVLVPEHRPEAAARRTAPAASLQQHDAVRRHSGPSLRGAAPTSSYASPVERPLWLLREPLALEVMGDDLGAAGYRLLGGPERIETGWWDGRDVQRDYYRARTPSGAEVWLFREREPPHRWFIHGIF
ncbi:MAG: DNA polymerase Y family protein, partial [Gammaproteobacteria bacterium]|nr:DNA polymerase Y family protein [Gammaproteobacteria bacterium]